METSHPTNSPNPNQQPPPDTLYRELESYPWATDSEFQSGLRAILPTRRSDDPIVPHDNPSTEGQQIADLTLNARVFYFCRISKIPDLRVAHMIHEYKTWRKQRPPDQLSGLDLVQDDISGSAGSGPDRISSVGDLVGGSSNESTPRKQRLGHGVGAGAAQNHPLKIGSAAGSQQQPQQQHHEEPSPQTTSFAEIMELIQSGKPIPGIKEIPDTVLEGQGTQPARARRQKPWEQEAGAATQQYGLLGGQEDE